MSRTNLILLGVLALLVILYVVGRDEGAERLAGPAERMFPAFNKEAVDRIEIEGGWQGDAWNFRRVGSDWRVASAGGYPVKKEAIDTFVDAVFNLRGENAVGSSAALHAETGTDVKHGRLVRVYKGDSPMAEFRVGHNPKGYGSYQEFFVRKESDDTVYRTRTILTKDQGDSDLDRGRVQGFAWHNYLNRLHTEWLRDDIWDLADTETEEVWLNRGDELDVRLVKKADDKWDLFDSGSEEPVPGDADAAESITSQARYLRNSGVLGLYEEVRVDCGLDKPEMTLVLTLKKKVEKTPAEGEEKEEGEEEPAEEYVTLKRTLEVGTKITRPRDLDRETGEIETEELYPIRIGGEFDDPEEEARSNFVFLVTPYSIDPLRKELDELKSKEEEKEPAEEERKPDEPAEPETPGEDATEPEKEPEEEAAEPENKPEEEPAQPEKQPEEPPAEEPKGEE